MSTSAQPKPRNLPPLRRATPVGQVPRTTQLRTKALSEIQPLLCTRDQTRKLLGGISRATLVQLEKEGRLDQVRLSENGMVFHRMSQVRKLAQESA